MGASEYASAALGGEDEKVARQSPFELHLWCFGLGRAEFDIARHHGKNRATFPRQLELACGDSNCKHKKPHLVIVYVLLQ